MIKNLIIFVLFLSFSFSAWISGEVFLPDFSKPNISIMEINTTPSQTIVIFNGSYSINLSNGSYNITVYYVENNKLFQSSKMVIIRDSNNYIIDFVLFPLGIEDVGMEVLEDESVIEVISMEEKKNPSILFDVIILVISLVILFYLARKKFSRDDKIKLPSDLILILRHLKSNGNRMLQRELREELKWSEAKLSLALSELEHLGYVRRIKKGRGNIISLIKDYEEKG